MRPWFSIPGLLLLFSAGTAHAQCLVQGRVIAPGADLDRYHEVLQLDESRLVGWAYTNSTGAYSLPSQPGGKYYIVVRIDGFKEYRERLDLAGCPNVYTHIAFLEAEEEPIPQVILDFTGEVNEVVDVTELKQQFPRKAVNEFERARSERLKAQADVAQKRLEKLLQEYPDFYDARNVLGSIYLEAKRFRDAEAQYNRARELRPNSAAPLVSLGSLYVQEAEASIEPDPAQVDVAVLGADLGVILDDARSVLERAIKIKPDASFAYYLLGIVQMRAARYGESEQLLRRSLEIESKLRWARLALCNLYIRQERLRDALAEFDAYLRDFKKVANIQEVTQVRAKVAERLEKKGE
jgi:tetratricopeptide (TPR) repeat protein